MLEQEKDALSQTIAAMAAEKRAEIAKLNQKL
jgi:hypothetical protein